MGSEMCIRDSLKQEEGTHYTSNTIPSSAENNNQKRGSYMTAQIVFHGINRSAAVEAAVNKKLEGLAKFDNQIGPCKVTVTQEGHQTMGPFTIRVDLVASGRN